RQSGRDCPGCGQQDRRAGASHENLRASPVRFKSGISSHASYTLRKPDGAAAARITLFRATRLFGPLGVQVTEIDGIRRRFLPVAEPLSKLCDLRLMAAVEEQIPSLRRIRVEIVELALADVAERKLP